MEIVLIFHWSHRIEQKIANHRNFNPHKILLLFIFTKIPLLAGILHNSHSAEWKEIFAVYHVNWEVYVLGCVIEWFGKGKRGKKLYIEITSIELPCLPANKCLSYTMWFYMPERNWKLKVQLSGVKLNQLNYRQISSYFE